jgi:NADH:ubiquinone oxidoreductase subunit 5 (subunit L)/multisubunit Na+/H+ antiporter MnhA subunit
MIAEVALLSLPISGVLGVFGFKKSDCSGVFIAIFLLAMSAISECPYYLDINWLSIDGLDLGVSISLDELEYTFVMTVCLILFCLHLFKRRILDKNVDLKFATLDIFTFFMCTSIVAVNMLQFYVGLEAMSIISAILVGLEDGACKQSSNVFLFNKFASLLFLVGICCIYVNVGSFDFDDIARFCRNSKADKLFLPTLALVIACLCKGAQFPFSRWIIEATKASPFVSILIHSATIVSVGVIFLIKCDFLINSFQSIKNFLVFIGVLSALIMSSRSLTYEQSDMKKIMACLSASSAGMMFASCGLGNYEVASVYFVCHAFFKATMFLCFVCAVHSSISPPVIWVSALSACGLPFLPGYFAKISMARSFDFYIILSVFEMVISVISGVAIIRLARKMQSSRCIKNDLSNDLIIAYFLLHGAIVSKNSYNLLIGSSWHLGENYVEPLSIAASAFIAIFLIKKPLPAKVRKIYRQIFQDRNVINFLEAHINNIARLLSRSCEALERAIGSCSCMCIERIYRHVSLRQKSLVSSHVLWMTVGITTMIAMLIFETAIAPK